MTITKPILGVRRANTNVGDTVQAIALRELGDTARWHDLVAINNLLPPYLTDDMALAGPRVLLAGQQNIRIPASAPPASGVADPDTVFGSDISLARGRIEATDGGDMLTISGTPNLSQALTNALATHPGDLAYHRTYGCDVYRLIGQGASTTRDRLAAAFVARTIRADRRVARVEGATGTITGDTIDVTATAVAVDGKRVLTGVSSGSPGSKFQ